MPKKPLPRIVRIKLCTSPSGVRYGLVEYENGSALAVTRSEAYRLSATRDIKLVRSDETES